MFGNFRRGGRGRGQSIGRGQGGGTSPGSGPGGYCICPTCGYKEAHKIGQRCVDIACPKCGTKMRKQ